MTVWKSNKQIGLWPGLKSLLWWAYFWCWIATYEGMQRQWGKGVNPEAAKEGSLVYSFHLIIFGHWRHASQLLWHNLLKALAKENQSWVQGSCYSKPCPCWVSLWCEHFLQGCQCSCFVNKSFSADNRPKNQRKARNTVNLKCTSSKKSTNINFRSDSFHVLWQKCGLLYIRFWQEELINGCFLFRREGHKKSFLTQ